MRENGVCSIGFFLNIRRPKIRNIIWILIFFICPACISHGGEFHTEYHTAYLDNGTSIVCNYIPDSPIVTIEMRVLSGLSNEGKYAGSGISHFLEHLLFKGTNSKTADDIRREIKAMGGVVNGSTGRDSAEYHITVPAENFEEALNLLADMVMELVFTDEEMETEREVILKEIKLHNDDPTGKRIRLLFAQAYRHHIYKNPIIGEEEKLKKLSREDILNYHRAVYTPPRIVVGIAGGIAPAIALKVAEKKFEGYEEDSLWKTEIFQEPEQTVEVKTEFPAEITLGYMAIGFHMTDIYSPELYAGDVLSILLGGGNDSRLYKELVKEKKLLYTVATLNYTPEFPGLFIITGAGEPDRLEEAREEIFGIIEDFKRGSVQPGEIERAKNLVVSEYLQAHEKIDAIVSSMTNSQILMNDPAFFEKYVEGIKKVTKEQVKEVLLKYLKKDNSTTVFLLPQGYLGEPVFIPGDENLVQDFPKKILEKDRKRSLDKHERLESGKIKAGVDIPEEKYQKRAASFMTEESVLLANGLKLIVKRKGELPLVSVTFAAFGGLRAETRDNNGISNLMASLVLKGTDKRSEAEIIPVIEGMGGSINAFSGMDSTGVSMDVLSKDLNSALEIFEDVIKNAAFPEEEILKQKERIQAFIQEQESNIFENGIIHLRKMLYKDHPYAMRILGEVQSIEEIRREEIQSFYKEHFIPAGSAITVVGNIDVRETIERFKKAFEKWEGERKPLPARRLTLLRKRQQKDIDMKKEQSLFLMGFQSVRNTDRRRYTLDVISALLSGADGILFHALRKERGLSYLSGAVSVPEMDPGYFVLYAATTEEDIKKTGNTVFNIIKKFITGYVSEEEIEFCKKRLITQYAYALETNHALSIIMALDELCGLGYKSYKKYPDEIKAVRRRDIIKCARQIFRLNKCAVVIIHSGS